jgi:RNA polymerase sigma factor (sigma-70 family)
MVPFPDRQERSTQSLASSVSEWIAGIKAGRAEAAERLWRRYFADLVRLARKKLRSARRSVADEEDVAAIVFQNLWQGAKAGRFPELRNRDNLWPLLVVLTSRRVNDLFRYQQRRGCTDALENLDILIATGPTPEYAATMAENMSRLFSLLDPEQAEIGRRKLEGFENDEIARELGCSLRSVQRKLQIIRRKWDMNP